MKGLDLFNQVSIYKPRPIIVRFVQIRQDLCRALSSSCYWIERCCPLQRFAPVNLVSGERSEYMNSVALPRGAWLSSLIGDRCGGSRQTPLSNHSCGTSRYRDDSSTKFDSFINQFMQFSYYMASPLLFQWIDTINSYLISFKNAIELKNIRYRSVSTQIMFITGIHAICKQFQCSSTLLDLSRTSYWCVKYWQLTN
jgi:hypothetical protein